MKKAKPKRGRPISAEPKTKRYMIRLTPEMLVRFETRARDVGYGSAGAWLIALGLRAADTEITP